MSTPQHRRYRSPQSRRRPLVSPDEFPWVSLAEGMGLVGDEPEVVFGTATNAEIALRP